jgi:hypothetical protein
MWAPSTWIWVNVLRGRGREDTGGVQEMVDGRGKLGRICPGLKCPSCTFEGGKNPQNSLSQKLIIHSLHRPDDLWDMVGVLFAFLKSLGVCICCSFPFGQVGVGVEGMWGPVKGLVFFLHFMS